jgi:glycosyltransferase involved in cell wall biosynthesis
VEWSPIPSSFESVSSELPVSHPVSRDKSPKDINIGHFGTFAKAIANLLEPIILEMAEKIPRAHFVLLGRGGKEFAERLEKSGRIAPGRITATGPLGPKEITAQIQLCDLLIQPFPDGISTRRTSAMAGLLLGLPMITQTGHLTESVWSESRSVQFVPDPSPGAWAETAQTMIDAPEERMRLGSRALELYWTRFALARTLDRLLERGEPSA